MNLGEAIVKIGADNEELKAKIRDSSARLDAMQKKVSSNNAGMSKSFDGLGGAIAGAFSVGAVVSFGQKVIETTATFQRLEAVLTNTLGSQEASTKAFSDIKDFAAKTNFGVLELTDAYVKLTNQNLQPSMEQMRKYADVANSTGKTFDQLTEAIIDATTGQFERLKEFGILASKNGDKVKFSFKGVTTETNFTSDSIQKYIEGLGSLEGVSGATAKISETLGGKISNLGDTFDEISVGIGQAFFDSLSELGSVISDIFAPIGELISSIGGLNKEFSIGEVLGKSMTWMIKAFTYLIKPLVKLMQLLSDGFKYLWKNSEMFRTAIGYIKKGIESVIKVFSNLGGILLAIGNSFNHFFKAVQTMNFDGLGGKISGEFKKAFDTKPLEEQAEAIKEVKKEVKELSDEQKKAALEKRNKSLNLDSLKDNQLNIPLVKASKAINGVVENLNKEFEKGKPATLNIPVSPKLEITDTSGIKEASGKLILDLQDSFKNIGMLAATTLGAALGTAFAGGDLSAIGADFLNGVASIVQGIGQQMISLGIAALLAKDSLKLLFANPALAIGAGVALVAVAGAMKSLMSQSAAPFANGGLVTGPTLGLVGEGIGTSRSNPEVIAPLDKLAGFMNPSGGGEMNLRFELEGSKLVAATQRYSKTSKYSR